MKKQNLLFIIMLLAFFSFKPISEINPGNSNYKVDCTVDGSFMRKYETNIVTVVVAVYDGDCYYQFVGAIDLDNQYNYSGIVTAIGNPPCPNGEWPVSNSVKPGNIQFGLEGGSTWCSATDMNFSAAGGGVSDPILNALNYNSSVILEEIQKDSGC
jgi:hypothetical protein